MNTKPKQLLPAWFYLNIEVVRNLEKPLLRFAQGFCLSHSQIEQMCKMAKDLSDWRELVPLRDFLRQQAEHLRSEVEGRKVSLQKIVAEQSSHNGDVILPQRRKQAMAELEAFYLRKKQILPNFQRNAPRPKVPKYRFEVLSGDPSHDPGDSALERVGETGKNAAWESAGERILGLCPVASVKTRCCNLLTLDAIQQCGFGCSYCAIQHFYDEKSIQVHGDFAQKLERLRLDPERWYHIGTGQSSDSLLWTEELGVLEPLIAFAERYPRVILELKSKSANVQNLLRRELPANMLFTWSLNPDSFVQHEELLTAPLDARLRSARALADRGAKVGFHFHPIVRYQGWKTEYAALASRLTSLFTA
ncbi:MAG: spore photoproduct lyase family protein [Spirochaetota bacterium]